ncbi:NAD(P)-binding protein [Nordella sp. HKS 07]|uniref:NAD(P)/FAD-dependent oxidoreductase n=1 Tax=Nordella sp. HKS 07 TaxID=2712222 RepID=UPI0013E11C3E|nr:NAD(P)-binding protein [Nordella sp. HKS 07]QIG47149.1 NAD(P)-binding protein [Nordella sp. HKS 07]
MKDTAAYDLVIVGASFAGLACARAAAFRGLRTLVLEAKTDPGARISTTGIIVKEAADEIDIPPHLTRTVHGVRLYAPSLRSVDLFAPGYYFLTSNTADLMRWMAREAETAGAKIRCSTRLDRAVRQGDMIFLPQTGLRTRYLVGADGARSTVARLFDLGRNTRFLTGIEVEYPFCPRPIRIFSIASSIRVWRAAISPGWRRRPASSRWGLPPMQTPSPISGLSSPIPKSSSASRSMTCRSAAAAAYRWAAWSRPSRPLRCFSSAMPQAMSRP